MTVAFIVLAQAHSQLHGRSMFSLFTAHDSRLATHFTICWREWQFIVKDKWTGHETIYLPGFIGYTAKY